VYKIDDESPDKQYRNLSRRRGKGQSVGRTNTASM